MQTLEANEGPLTQSDLAAAQIRLFKRLAELGLPDTTVDYPASRTVEEGKTLRGQMAGTFTKNLLVKDKKKRLFMVVVEENRAIGMKQLARAIRATGHLSFASAETMTEVLGVLPGALTPFAFINEPAQHVDLVLDKSLLSATQLNFHPLVNTESTGITPAGLLSFLRSCATEPLIVDFDEPPPC